MSNKTNNMSLKKLKEIMASHAKWLANEYSGYPAHLKDLTFKGTFKKFKNFDFSRVMFENINVEYATFENCKFNKTTFENCFFKQAYFDNCEFIDCETVHDVNFYGAGFDKCNFNSAHLFESNFCEAYFDNCSFVEANLDSADFRNAQFEKCDLTDISYDELTAGIALACPEQGPFVAFKKAHLYNGDRCVVKLYVPADAKRSSSTSRKCRVSKAKVVAVYNMDGALVMQNAYSNHTSSFVYKPGSMVSVKNFDPNRWNECSTGIHCFITKAEAEQYC